MPSAADTPFSAFSLHTHLNKVRRRRFYRAWHYHRQYHRSRIHTPPAQPAYHRGSQPHISQLTIYAYYDRCITECRSRHRMISWQCHASICVGVPRCHIFSWRHLCAMPRFDFAEMSDYYSHATFTLLQIPHTFSIRRRQPRDI